MRACTDRRHLYQRDGRAIVRLAQELIRQVGHYERNGTDGWDQVRFLLIRSDALRLAAVAKRAAARYERERRERIARDET